MRHYVNRLGCNENVCTVDGAAEGSVLAEKLSLILRNDRLNGFIDVFGLIWAAGKAHLYEYYVNKKMWI